MATMNAEKMRKRSAALLEPERRKRQKTVHPTSATLSAADLALDHLLHDSEDSPLHEKDVNQLLDSVCSQEALSGLLQEPLAQLMRQVDTTVVASSEKLAAVRDELLAGWTSRVMQAAGNSLSNVIDLSKARGPMAFELNGAKMELRFVPVLEIEDTDAAISAADERENTAGIEDLSIQGRGEDSDESSETETDSTVSTETRKKQRERNTGGSMGIFYNKPSRVQPRHIPLLERGYTMRELYGSPSITSSREREREPPKRVEMSGTKDRMAVIEEHESDEDEDEDEEDEHTGPGTQGQGAVRESTVGNEPMSPDASGVESDDGRPANAGHSVVPQQSGLSIWRSQFVTSPEKCLVLARKNIVSSHGPRRMTCNEIAAALSASDSAAPAPSIKPAGANGWHLVYKTVEAATGALARPLRLRGKTAKLSPFKVELTQTFMSTKSPATLDIDYAVNQLHEAFPSARFYVGRCQNNNNGIADNLVVVFDQANNMTTFQISLRLLNGQTSVALFKARSNGVQCFACTRYHPLAECESLSAVQTLRSHKKLLAIPPTIRPE
ncbi:hypothetical protein LTR17_011096 [Elasticomyces elasticus]|nr:hypothetical protein LTR17_011096 [Elasticomyces elasticus]